MRHWTPEQRQAAIEAVAQKDGYARAAQHLGKLWGTTLTAETIRHIVRRAREVQDGELPGELPDFVTLPKSIVAPPVDRPWQAYKPTPRFKLPDDPKLKTDRAAMTRVAIIPDAHVPFQHSRAWACTLGILKEWHPNVVVIIGDLLDMESVSKHPKSRPDLVRLAEEYRYGNYALDALQNAVAGGCDWYYIEGNHERRAVKYANEHGTLDGLLKVPEQLYITHRGGDYHRDKGGELRGMVWVPYEAQPLLLPHSAYYHGHTSTSRHHASWHADVYCPRNTGGRTLFYGHNHTFQGFTSTTGNRAQCVGFLGNDKAPALGYLEGRPTTWEHGLVLQEVAPGGQMSYTAVRIINGRAVFHGAVVDAEIDDD